MAAGPITERNQDATIYVGGLDEKVSETLLWELFLQAGPVVNVHMPKDRITQLHQGYGFVEFLGEEDADYAIKVMNMIKVYGKPVRVNKASSHNKNLDVGANIFIGNLDPEIDEKLLYDTFSAFGVILQTPKIMRDPETGNSKGFAFINFASFDAADAAIEAMNSQYLCNRPISISYAFKKDSKGERHGSAAERLLASQNPLAQADKPHQLFADAPPSQVNPFMDPSMMVMGGVPPPPTMPPPGLPPPGVLPPNMGPPAFPPQGLPHPGMPSGSVPGPPPMNMPGGGRPDQSVGKPNDQRAIRPPPPRPLMATTPQGFPNQQGFAPANQNQRMPMMSPFGMPPMGMPPQGMPPHGVPHGMRLPGMQQGMAQGMAHQGMPQGMIPQGMLMTPFGLARHLIQNQGMQNQGR